MDHKFLKPRQALNKAFLKVKPVRTQIEVFKGNLIRLFDQINESESEEFHKNLVSDFLKRTYYEPDFSINTKGRNDMVIHNGKDAKSPVGVILETKKPTNRAEMLSLSPEAKSIKSLNVKSFHELILYFLRERITQNNLEVKHLVVTNIYEWFVFDASVFEKAFAQNKTLVKDFKAFEEGRLSGNTTDFFYKEIASREIDKLEGELPFTYFDLRNYDKPLRNADKKDDVKLIALFKLLSPEHMLKLPFSNDSNNLDKRFYSELLHIIGLTETKEGGKKLIGRNKEGERNTGSILEDAIIQLDSLDKISRLSQPSQFGKTHQERLFNVALELSITWINRILFLKLLEAQLFTYHKEDKSYSFLSLDKIKNYDDLNSLFFQVLARKFEDRNPDVKALFEKVPYLNSSLFEPTDIEHSTLFISNLRDDKLIPIISSTVLKNEQGKKRTGKLSTLEYLFEFLNAYDFSSEGSEDIQEDNKTLINASVLGLIFEKINGYKDGSFFTPGFITMYMCRETIRRAVVQKFKEEGFKISEGSELSESLDQIYDQIEDRKQANEIVNSIKICDPAVGSGHFLVSALNEMIAVKNDLKILQDRNGKRLKEYQVEVVNDELIVTDEEGELFEYNPSNKESQRIQETLFHEKQTIIENCLFGVDINPNSVKICRLRLWIELLKNAYYKNATELETLPNIDINIKCGNSLVSRFAIDADLSEALKKSKFSIDSYRMAVTTYRNAQNKEEKREMELLIAEIKSDFRSEIANNDPKIKRKAKLGGELYNLTMQTGLFEASAKQKKDTKKRVEKIETELVKLSTEIEEIKNNKIYENAFEWRFEFPEVLNDTGDFVGFDAVIGNPPYVNAIELKKSLHEKEYAFYKNSYSTAKGSVDLYIYFFELGFIILRDNSYLNYITPNRFLSASYGFALRDFLLNKTSILNIGDYSNVKVFKEASTYPVTTLFKKLPNNHNLKSFTFIDEYQPIKFRTYKTEDLFSLNDFILGFVLSEKYEIVSKIITQSEPLGKCGIINATSTAKEADDFNAYINESEGFKLINTGTIDKFTNTWGETSLVDKKKKYLRPFLPKSKEILGKNRFELYSRPKIILAKIAITPEAYYDEKGEYASVNTNCIHSFSKQYHPEYILGWVNSKLFRYLFECFFDGLKMSGGYLLYSAPNLLNTYIKRATSQEQNKIVSEVRKIIVATTNNENEKIRELVQRIDQMFYQLFDLTEEEIKIIEKEEKCI
ncbi:Eco57I restriction-modification methylase domain-containing protein [Belliella sp. DSM 111904]|uniref:site-specific DNA-methyltransferase (adenine-specific) n=1 Tax=Belliella filtrata TaxID=2923435 RepID=A0ABS9V1S7_9BACT|nr:Eco57I restriction-modification methylase domain-containing protein [Belliella filtrata]MCH7409928.1 Eco57I restriction-modification methylase domain-containing protein [Belliella filtrata]